MSTKLYVGNLPFTLTKDQLSELFSEAGNVSSIKLIKDPFDGQSRGYGFVEMTTDQEADKAVQLLNGREIEGRNMRVASANSNDHVKIKPPSTL